MSESHHEPQMMIMGGRSRGVSELTIKEYAAVERVTERTVRRWIDKEAVRHRKTPGGQYRIIVQRNASA